MAGMKQTFNHEGRGRLLGYPSDIADHEKSCQYRDERPGKQRPCNCSKGTWTEDVPAEDIAVRNTSGETIAQKAPDRAPESDGKGGARKMDADKPPIVQGFLNYFPRAVMAVAWVSEYGDRKYVPADAPVSAHYSQGWAAVPNGIARYADAEGRHRLKQSIEGPYDSESDLAHLSHKAWCVMAELERALRENVIELRRGNEIVNGVPQPGTFRKVSL